MKQFNIDNISPEWMDIVEEFPEFILECSPFLEELNLSTPKDNIVNLRFGFEYDIGWKQITKEHFTRIRELINLAKSNDHEVSYKTCILKQKFGELVDQGDFYGPHRELYVNEFIKILNDTGDKSLITCEICGNVGELKGDGKIFRSYKTVCEKHEYIIKR